MLIHIIEDDRGVADSLALVLEGLQFQPQIYNDGEAFLEEAKVAVDDVVIVDLGLPGISGSELINRLRTGAKNPHVVAISGKPANRLKEHQRELPDIEILRKPLSVETLVTAIGQP